MNEPLLGAVSKADGIISVLREFHQCMVFPGPDKPSEICTEGFLGIIGRQ